MLVDGATAVLAAAALGLGGAEAAPCGADEFSGTALDAARWSVLRPAGSGPAVADGRLRLELRDGALAGERATAQNVVVRDAPDTGWTATTRLGTTGVDAPGEQAGIVLWRSEGPGENTFSTLTYSRAPSGAPRFEALHTDRSVPAIPVARSSAPAPAGLLPDVQLRLRSDGVTVRAAFSADEGASWTAVGEPARIGGQVRIGLLGVGTGGAATFDRFDVSCGPQVELTSSPERGAASLEMGISATLRDDVDDEFALHLAWDFGDGTTGEGEHARLHKFIRTGSYRPTLRATDSDGNTTTASRTISVLESDPPCPAVPDAFDGNGLDPRWRVLRPVPSGLDVRGGRLWLRPYAGDPAGGDGRNVVLAQAPSGPWTMTTAVDVSALAAPGDQVALVLWREAPVASAELAFVRTGATTHRIVRTATAVDAATAEPPGPVPGVAYLRIVSDGARPPAFTALHSSDGEAWAPLGAPFRVPGSGLLHAGVAASGSSVSEPAGFEGLTIEGPQPCGAPDTLAPETTHVLDPAAGAVRVSLTAVDDATGSGVARTEFRLGDGPFGAYDGPFTLSARGEHVVGYRSVDRAGNVEAEQRVTVAIAAPPPPGPGPSPGGGEPRPARSAAVPQPVVRPILRLRAPARARLRALVRHGVRVELACDGVASVRVRLWVGGRAARRLGLERRTLADRAVRCSGRRTVRLRPSRAVRAALRGVDRRLAATLDARGAGLRATRRVAFR